MRANPILLSFSQAIFFLKTLSFEMYNLSCMTVRISRMHFYDVATIFLHAGGKFSTDVIFYVMPKVYSKGH